MMHEMLTSQTHTDGAYHLPHQGESGDRGTDSIKNKLVVDMNAVAYIVGKELHCGATSLIYAMDIA
jgi:hypothetical protein